MTDEERLRTVRLLSALLSAKPRGFVKETRAGTRYWSACVFACFYRVWGDCAASRVVAISMLQSYGRYHPLTALQKHRLAQWEQWIESWTETSVS